ncbi:acyl-n-acyltransferase [Echria macrotheca]|uniref:Acyl-n-acyltransferase n=1 Tax=Echria macrotheca TaxID=438768 RepID=A0AAJ0BL23_9PEZI|nr:acyl-n-acyltransferase [Echria macrotheca]
MSITTRQALPSDIPAVAALLAASPDDGSLYQFPNITRPEHQAGMRRAQAGWITSLVRGADRTTLVRVAVLGQDSGPEKVVGFSSWQKRELYPTTAPDKGDGDGNGGKAERRQRTRLVELRGDPVEELIPSEKEIIRPAADGEEDEESPSEAALTPNPTRSAAVRRLRKRLPPSPALATPCYELHGLSVHPDHRGQGIGKLLVRWGLERAAAENLPVFATGEAGGVDFYVRALGFQTLRGSEYWLDAEGNEISEEEVKGANVAYKKENGGLYGAEVVWCPKGVEVDVRGHVYSSRG